MNALRRVLSKQYLVGHWPLCSHADDVSGHGYDGTLVNTPTWGDQPYGRSCLVLNGDTQYVNVGDVTELNHVAAFTYATWFAQDVLDTLDHLFRKYGTVANDFIVRTQADGDLAVVLDVGSNEDGHFDYSAVVSAGAPHHISVVYDGTGTANADRLKVYIDAKPVTLAFTGTIPALSPSLAGHNAYIGYSSTTFDGKIWDVRIYNCALQGDEIAALVKWSKL